jgi:hypothetical protein
MEPEGPPGPVMNQLNPVHTLPPISFTRILILSSHLSLGLSSGLFPSGFPNTPYSYSIRVLILQVDGLDFGHTTDICLNTDPLKPMKREREKREWGE